MLNKYRQNSSVLTTTKVEANLVVIGITKDSDGFDIHFCSSLLKGSSNHKAISTHDANSYGHLKHNAPDFYDTIMTLSGVSAIKDPNAVTVIKFVVFHNDIETRNECVKKIRDYLQPLEHVQYENLEPGETIEAKLKAYFKQCYDLIGFAKTREEFNEIVRQDVKQLFANLGNRIEAQPKEERKYITLEHKALPAPQQTEPKNQKPKNEKAKLNIKIPDFVTVDKPGDQNYRKCIRDIYLKGDDLIKRGFRVEGIIAHGLAVNLDKYYDRFLQDNNYEEFSRKSNKKIQEAKQSNLKNHRDCKWILWNVFCGIIGLGVFYYAALHVHQHYTKRWYFYERTASQEKLDNAETFIKNLKR